MNKVIFGHQIASHTYEEYILPIIQLLVNEKDLNKQHKHSHLHLATQMLHWSVEVPSLTG